MATALDKTNHQVDKADATAEKNRLTASVVLGAAIVLAVAELQYGEYINSWRLNDREGLHHWMVPIVAISLYILMVLLLPKYMKDRKPMQLQSLMLVHNYILSTGSLAATIAVIRELVPMAMHKDPITTLVCDPQGLHSKSPLYFWYYVFYLSKMYEFIDTLILILRKKPLIFLHVYHHIITLALCWCMLDDKMSIQWLSTAANTIIHTFMYYFYACQSLGLDVWWKRYLTKAQIVQFIVGNVGNISWSYYKVAKGLDCSGSWFGFAFGVGVIASFLLLFIQFYIASYKKKKTQKLKDDAAAAAAETNGNGSTSKSASPTAKEE